ncbi:MAG: TetR/AcrR family transcriptional regulator [Nitriliruptoraceae bacterium]|nr:TetR/AcrR family transcriptional regulator [Nitriliruptoraceae bacterium]
MDGSGPRTARGERTRDRVRDAARQTFRERGYAAARVEDIVALAGVSHGTFYTYFENKAAVLDALIDDTAAELQAVLDAPWDGPDGSTAIAGVIERFVTVFAAHGDVVRVWVAAAATEPHFAHRLTRVRAGYVDRVADGLAPVLARSPHDPGDAAAALVAMVEGYATQGMGDDPVERRTAVVQTLAALWLGGLVRLAEDLG